MTLVYPPVVPLRILRNVVATVYVHVSLCENADSSSDQIHRAMSPHTAGPNRNPPSMHCGLQVFSTAQPTNQALRETVRVPACLYCNSSARRQWCYDV
jgi:hypothetical protein